MFQTLAIVEMHLSRGMSLGLALDLMAGTLVKAKVPAISNALCSANVITAHNSAAPPGAWLN